MDTEATGHRMNTPMDILNRLCPGAGDAYYRASSPLMKKALDALTPGEAARGEAIKPGLKERLAAADRVIDDRAMERIVADVEALPDHTCPDCHSPMTRLCTGAWRCDGCYADDHEDDDLEVPERFDEATGPMD